jgi:hypothetical protein
MECAKKVIQSPLGDHRPSDSRRFGVAKALGMIDTVVTDNVGAAFHLPSGRELPDYAGPASRAASVLVAAGLEVDRFTRLNPKAR